MGLKELGPRPFAYAGIAAVIVMTAAVVICFFSAPDWDYLTDSMCDFVVSKTWYVPGVFIGGCVISGLLFMFSGLGWYLFEESKYVRIAGIVMQFSGISLICVGVLDVTYWFHQYVTITFTVIFIIAVAFVSVQDLIDRHYILVIGLGLLGLFGLSTLFDDYCPYSMVQIVLVGFTFVWYILKSLKPFDPQSPMLRKIIGMD